MKSGARRFASGKRAALACAWLTVLLCAASVNAQRALHWDSLDVSAQLDDAGRLHVIERHAFVFDGDWNGGVRRFRVQGRQRFELLGIRRIDAASGAAVPLVPGDLERVDEYALTDRTTLRWRSRLPSDP